MKKKSEVLLRLIIGQSDTNLRPLAYAIAHTADLLCLQGLHADELCVTKHVYPTIAKHLHKTRGAIARAVERGANLCWDKMTDGQKLVYLGRKLDDITSLKELIIYLAYYVYYGKPYFEVMASML